ncbi:MAG: type IX secretion system membrane protein PorP/SprF, partial [Elusimicrobia bacterium]|nr:type IX secretion system membrane protein PorP/SprF [Elusimicrobiota bacterium]
MRISLCAAAFLAFVAAPARAAFEDLGAGARAPGMGDAFTAIADDVYAIHYNPAGLGLLERPQLGTSYAVLYPGLQDASNIGTSFLAYAQPLARGRNGTLATAWSALTLGSLYREDSLYLGYGRRWLDLGERGELYGGVNIKRLRSTFGSFPEAGSAVRTNGLVGGGQSDPLLSGQHSQSAIDADWGLLYRFPRRFQAGLSVKHLLSPNVAFAGSEKLERAIDAGLAYRSLWLSLAGEMKLHQSASGGMQRDLIFAAERFFPTLEYGQFGLRGALGIGSDDWRQISVGSSYRINKIQFDYAFLIPVGGVKGLSGSHRMALTFHFGAPTGDEEMSRDILEQAQKLRERGPDYGYEYSPGLKPQSLDDPRLAAVRGLILQRRYRLAQKALTDFAKNQSLSPALIRLSNRLGLIASYYPELPEPNNKFDANLIAALRGFLYGEDRAAMLRASYAYSMKPDDALTARFIDEMEKALGLKADRLSRDHPRGFIDEILYRAEFAHTRGDFGRAETLLKDVLVLDPESVTAIERMGSLRYEAGRFLEANQIWEAALKLETRQKEIESLRGYMKLAAERAGG